MREARIAVIGLGYVGLPLALAYAAVGFPTFGLEIQPEKVALLQRGSSPIKDLPAAAVSAAVRSGRFRPGDDFSVLADADCIIICVPTPLRKTREPDISAIVAAGQQIRERLRPGQLVVLSGFGAGLTWGTTVMRW